MALRSDKLYLATQHKNKIHYLKGVPEIQESPVLSSAEKRLG
jgi:hypothetical protein